MGIRQIGPFGRRMQQTYVPDRRTLAFYASKPVAGCEKARSKLGYMPGVSFSAGYVVDWTLSAVGLFETTLTRMQYRLKAHESVPMDRVDEPSTEFFRIPSEIISPAIGGVMSLLLLSVSELNARGSNTRKGT